MRELKADLHMHTAEDPYDSVGPSARDVIDRGARAGFEVIGITNHLTRVWSPELEKYAESRGVLLVSGAEIEIGLRHLLVLNPPADAVKARNFEELALAKKNSDRPMAIVAPHPFIPTFSALRRWAIDHVDIIDALEYCAFYFWGMNYNRRTERIARKLGLPVIGNSDAHYSWMFGRTYTMINSEKTVEGVINAIKAGRVRVVSRPLPLNKITIRMGLRGMRIPEYLLWKEWREGDPYWDSPNGSESGKFE